MKRIVAKLYYQSFVVIFIGLLLSSKFFWGLDFKLVSALIVWVGLYLLVKSNEGLNLRDFSKNGVRLYSLYLVTAVLWVTRSFFFDDNTKFTGTPILTIFGSLVFGVFLYILPILFLFASPKMLPTIFKSLKLIVGLTAIGFILSADMIMKSVTPFSFKLAMASIFICPFVFYLKRSAKWFYLAFLFVMIFIFEIVDERAAIMYWSLCLLGFIGVTQKLPKTVWGISMITGCIIVISVLVYSLYYGISIFQVLSELYSDKSDIVNDTRSFIFYELSGDLSRNKCWLFGKGILGTCYSPYFDMSMSGNGDSAYRLGLEVGFLQYMLKGGLFFVSLFMLTMLMAMYNAFFKSKNSFLKMVGVLILANYVLSCVSQGPMMDLRNFYLWIMMGCCFCKPIIEMTDRDLDLLLKLQ